MAGRHNLHFAPCGAWAARLNANPANGPVLIGDGHYKRFLGRYASRCWRLVSAYRGFRTGRLPSLGGVIRQITIPSTQSMRSPETRLPGVATLPSLDLLIDARGKSQAVSEMGPSTSFQAQTAALPLLPRSGHIAALHRSATKSAEARRGAADDDELRQAAGLLHGPPPIRREVRLQSHFSRQSEQCPLGPQFPRRIAAMHYLT